MPANHFNTLATHMLAEWSTRTVLQDGSYIEHDGNRYWFVYGPDGRQIASWECRPFPGCASLIVTSKLEIREDMRGQGLGKFFREMQHKAYKRAGFAGEISTIRTDNTAMNAIASGVPMGEFVSDFGGSYKLWLTTFAAPLAPHAPDQQPIMVNGRPAVLHLEPMVLTPAMLHREVMERTVPAPVVDTCGSRMRYTNDTFCDRPLGHPGNHSATGREWLRDPPSYQSGLIEGQTVTPAPEPEPPTKKYSHWK